MKNIFTKENIVKALKWFFFSFIWLGVLLFILDIVSKQHIMKYVALNDWSKRISLIPWNGANAGNFLAITYIQNNGMAFGINFHNAIANAVFFISISIIGAGLITFFYVKYFKKTNKIIKSALILMLAGCIGNLIDRAFYVDANGNHFVVDFIAFFGENGFPRFNIADSCLVIGCFMLLIYFIVIEVKDGMKKAKIERAKEIEQGTPNVDKKDNEEKK